MASASASAAAAAAATLRWWLVERHAVAFFEWDPLRTRFASPSVPAAAVVSYLALVLLLRPFLLLPAGARLPPLRRRLLRLLTPLHNAFLLLLSLAMAAGCSLAAAVQMSSPTWLFCFPAATLARGPVFFWAHAFYLSKLYELADTLLILLAADRRRLSFLHVYHHAAVVVMCYLWLAARQSLLPVALVTNAAVHVVMYGYYLCSSLGRRWRPQWKRAVTGLQIAQFCFSFAVSGVFLWLHFFGEGGCSGFWAWVANAVFNASLVALFLNFHKANYGPSKSRKAEDKAH